MRGPVTIVLVVLVVAGAAYFIFSRGGGGSVGLSVRTDKSSYAPGEQINVTLNLTNEGSRATCISRTPKGTVEFLSVTRDGAPVASRSARSYYITALPEIMKFELVEVAAGASIDVALVSAEDPGLGAAALSTTAIDGTAGNTTFYDISKPGAYEIDVRYAYTGEGSVKCGNAFDGSTAPSKISFTVTE
jgi:hypothetical protein